MKIIIATDSFKESLSALDVAIHIQKGFMEVFPNACYIKCPVADGGEGTVVTMIESIQGSIVEAEVTGPLGNKVCAFLGLSRDKTCAFIEMAAASGLALVPPEKRNPLITTSFGTGELIKAALDQGARRFIIGIGGSATNDGGAGMIQALGGRLLDKRGRQIPFGGGGLAKLDKIDVSGMDKRLLSCQFHIACDVTNPLLGEYGASAIFGPQKGATKKTIVQLDNNLARFAYVIKRDLNIEVADVPGAGAAGGMGAALLAFFRAELKPGFDIIAESLKLKEIIRDADLVITGEGRIDNQSINGKVPIGVAHLAKAHGIPVIVIAGCFGDGVEEVYAHGVDSAFSILNTVTTLTGALGNASENIHVCARNIAHTLKIGQRLKTGRCGNPF